MNRSRRSRLKSTSRSKIKQDHSKSTSKTSASGGLSALLARYLRHLPTLIIGLFFSGVVYFILTQIQPDKVKHFILPNSYLPLLFAFFFAIMFIFSFIWLNTPRGFFTAIVLSIILFLLLQQVILTPIIFGVLAAAFLVTNLIYKLISARF